MLTLARRSFLSFGGFLTLAAAPAVKKPTNFVSLTSDGVSHSPLEFAQLLARIAGEKNIVPDSYSREGIVAELEQRMASLLGKETAVFLPTGTLANHLAVRILADGRKVLVQQESHLYKDEGDCAQRLSGLNLVPLAPDKAAFTLSDVQEAVKDAEEGRVAAPVGAVSIETPVRRKYGEVFPFEDMKRIATFAREHGIRMHLDGARLFLAAPYTGIPVARYAALFDTVYISLYKYFNSGMGAILAGPRSLLENLYHTRRMFGGGVFQVWPHAAVALHFFEGFEERYSKAVATSEALLSKLAAHPGVHLERVSPGSNIAFATIPVADASSYRARLEGEGITVAARNSKTAGLTELALHTNETILRRSAEDLGNTLIAAMRG